MPRPRSPIESRTKKAELEVRFYVDPAAGSPHIHHHEIDEDELIEILEKPGEDRPGREGSRIALGQIRVTI